MLALINHEQKSRSLISHFVSEWWHKTLLFSVTHCTYVNSQGWYINFNEIYSHLVDYLVIYRPKVSQRDLYHLVDCFGSLPTGGFAERFIPFSQLFLWVVLLRGVTLSIFSYMKNPSRLEARWTNPPAALVVTCSVGLMRAVVRSAVHYSSNLLRCVYYLRFVKNRVCLTFINFVRRDVFINNYTYVKQYTTKYQVVQKVLKATSIEQ